MLDRKFDSTRAMIRKPSRIPAILYCDSIVKGSLVKSKPVLLYRKNCQPVGGTFPEANPIVLLKLVVPAPIKHPYKK